MIRITRLDGSQLRLNADLVQWVEGVPNTVVTLVTGEKVLAAETVDEVVSRVLAYKRASGGRPSPTPWTRRPRRSRRRSSAGGSR